MVRKIIDGYEHFECSNCGEETFEDADYCQVCGHQFREITEEDSVVLENHNASDEETLCIATNTRRGEPFIFTQLKVDTTPKFLASLPTFQNQRMMADPDPYEFYVFKASNYPSLIEGTQFHINLGNYGHFKRSDGVRFYYDGTQFSDDEQRELAIRASATVAWKTGF